ncbi:amino acid ABC transporter permease [Leucobacter sp. CSA1]|uniref:Amino acid ABC transporter permease n=1 Tax=Leucobacter chromiisoli TaxID=2796471 RepID=A0A934Q7K3_9MICO|nr:amino acid ABC transporter permease [Leucobacter chromiisoli]MBK0418302.1 amino acid ABC transporter permease [Leucobacter chromiisoli]
MFETLEYLPILLSGLWVTVQVALLSIGGTMIVSAVLGVVRSSRPRPVRRAGFAIVELLRGATVLIYLFWIYYALPLIPGAPQLSPLTASVLVISLGAGAYGAEIVRSGLQAVPRAQHDAVHALGLSKPVALFRVIFPQALVQIVPAFGSLAVDVVKWTSIVSFVGVQDLLFAAGTVRSLTQESMWVYLLVALVYIGLCYLTALVFRVIEALLPANRAHKKAELKPITALLEVVSK